MSQVESLIKSRPWAYALLWILIAGPSFFLFYGQANQYAASLPAASVGNLAFAWERDWIPFWSWTIIPYWSIDLMYGLSILLCTTKIEIRRQAGRLLLTTALSSICFVLWPLRFAWDRPEVHGIFGQMFTALGAFDKPFNQAPSLHISLLFIIWLRLIAHATPRWHLLIHTWCVLIGISVLTTWQHHFIDIPTGLAMGVVVCWLIPMPPLHWQRWHSAAPTTAYKLAMRYGLAAAMCWLIAGNLQGWAWLMTWPAAALSIIALAYAGLGPVALQKTDGTIRIAALWLTAPYRWGAQLTRTYYLKDRPSATEIVPGIWIGAITAASEPRFAAVLDLCAEYPRQAHPQAHYIGLPLLDLLPPSACELAQAVAHIETLRQHGDLLVHCALGLSRSAAVLATWLVQYGHVSDLPAALDKLAQHGCILHQPHLDQIQRHLASV